MLTLISFGIALLVALLVRAALHTDSDDAYQALQTWKRRQHGSSPCSRQR